MLMLKMGHFLSCSVVFLNRVCVSIINRSGASISERLIVFWCWTSVFGVGVGYRGVGLRRPLINCKAQTENCVGHCSIQWQNYVWVGKCWPDL